MFPWGIGVVFVPLTYQSLSGSAVPVSIFWRCSSNASEMYFRKISPSTMCLYSAASMLLRNLTAGCHSLASNPKFAPVSVF